MFFNIRTARVGKATITGNNNNYTTKKRTKNQLYHKWADYTFGKSNACYGLLKRTQRIPRRHSKDEFLN